jgi:IclR family pca regulon transcriptional regulator
MPGMSAPRGARLDQDADAAPAAAARTTDFVQSLQRGLAVIRAFDGDASGLTTSDVARSVGFTRAAARRFLLTLAELGYVRVDGRVFRLTPRVLELGRAYLASLTLPELARPHLAGFVEGVRESSSVAVLDGGDIVYIAQVAAKRVLSVSVTVGGRDPAFATSLGRVLLAAEPDGWLDAYVEGLELRPMTKWTIVDRAVLREELRRVRGQGWALVDQELEEGLRALAVPIRDEEGRVVAAVNVALHASRWSVEAIRSSLLPQLQATADAIERDIHASGVASYSLHAIAETHGG